MSSTTEPKDLATDTEATGAVPWNQQPNVSDTMCLRRTSVIDYTTLDSEDTRKNENCQNPSRQIFHINKDAQEKLDSSLIDLLDGQKIKYHFDRVAMSHESGSLLKDGSKFHDALLHPPSWCEKEELPWWTQPPGKRRSDYHDLTVNFLVDQPESSQKVRMVSDTSAEVGGRHRWAIIDAPLQSRKPFSMGFQSSVLEGIPVRKEYIYDPNQTSFEIVRPSTDYLDFMFSTLGKPDSSMKAFNAFKKSLADDDERVPDRSKVISWWLGPLVKDEAGKAIYSHDRDTGVTTQRREITYYLPYDEAEHRDEAYPVAEKLESSTQT